MLKFRMSLKWKAYSIVVQDEGCMHKKCSIHRDLFPLPLPNAIQALSLHFHILNTQQWEELEPRLVCDLVYFLEEGIRERIVRTIFECTEHHQSIATFRSRRTFFRHTVCQNRSVLYRVSSTICLKKVLRDRNVAIVWWCSVHSKIVPTIRLWMRSSNTDDILLSKPTAAVLIWLSSPQIWRVPCQI